MAYRCWLDADTAAGDVNGHPSRSPMPLARRPALREPPAASTRPRPLSSSVAAWHPPAQPPKPASTRLSRRRSSTFRARWRGTGVAVGRPRKSAPSTATAGRKVRRGHQRLSTGSLEHAFTTQVILTQFGGKWHIGHGKKSGSRMVEVTVMCVGGGAS